MGLKKIGEILFPKTIVDDYPDEMIYDDEEFAENEAGARAESGYAPRSSANVSVASGSSIEMKVVTPKGFDTAGQIADLLLDKKTVLLNLENTNREASIRLIDFLSGVAYALHGDIQKVADNTYAITPSNVAVSKESIGVAASAQPESDNGGINF